LAAVQQQITTQGLSFTTGYTPGVSEATIPQLTGAVPPPNLDEQIRQQKEVVRAELASNPQVALAVAAGPSGGTAPSPALPAWDWSKQGVVGSVKSQFFCGSCWDFASVGVFECMYAIRFGSPNLLDLSEEEILRCNTQPRPPRVVSSCCGGGASCCGGWWEFNYIKTKGLLGESKLAYLSGQVTCPDGRIQQGNIQACSTVAGIAGRRYYAATWDYVGNNASVPSQDLIKKALCDHGPLIAGVLVTEAFKQYKSGLFDERAAGGINHAIMIVGWNERGWILRNSWGPAWGSNGYMNIAYGSNSIGFAAAWVEPAVPQP
jgi:cathepsin L